ncbi:transglycosylase SLT domain-containing protein, partial [Actinoplanes sp. NPDC005259]
MFLAAGAKYNVSPKLLAAVAKVESGYNPKA